MKVLIVSYLFPPASGPVIQHPTWFLRYLRDFGMETRIVSGSVFHGVNEPDPPPSPDILSLPKGAAGKWLAKRLYHVELWAEYRFRTWDPGYVWSVLSAYPAAKRLVQREGFAAVVSTSPASCNHLVGLRLKKRFPHLRWVADFQDPLVDNPFRPENAWKRIDRALESAVFAAADVLSANTDTVMELWAKRYPQYRHKMTVCWNGYDPEEPMVALPLPPGEAKVLKYVGSLYGGRKADLLLDSVSRLARQGRLKPGELVLDFLGNVAFAGHEELAAELERQGFLRVNSNFVPRREALDAAAAAHYSLLLDITGQNTALQVPAKLFDQIRVGRPILAFTPAGSPTERILAGSGIRYIALTPDAGPDQVDSAVLQLMQMAADPLPFTESFGNTFDARSLAGNLAKQLRKPDSAG